MEGILSKMNEIADMNLGLQEIPIGLRKDWFYKVFLEENHRIYNFLFTVFQWDIDEGGILQLFVY